MKPRILLFLAFSLPFVFHSCKKTTADETQSEPKSSSIIVGSWLVDSSYLYTMKDGVANVTDLLANTPACKLDDIMLFNSNYSLWNLAGMTKCTQSESSSIDAGKWTLLNGDKTLRITPTPIPGKPSYQDYTISKLTVDTLSLEIYSYIDSNNYQIVSSTYLKQ